MLSPNSSRSALSFPFGVESSKYKRRVGIASNLIVKIYDVCVCSSGKRKGIWRKFIYIRDINSFERNRARWSEIWARTVWPTCFKIINFSRKSSFELFPSFHDTLISLSNVVTISMWRVNSSFHFFFPLLTKKSLDWRCISLYTSSLRLRYLTFPFSFPPVKLTNNYIFLPAHSLPRLSPSFFLYYTILPFFSYLRFSLLFVRKLSDGEIKRARKSC